MSDPLPEAAASRPSRVQRLVSTFFLLALLALAIYLGLSRGGSEPPPVLGAVGEFQLTDQSGKPFSSGELLGTVWVGDFIFTRCAAACPTMTRRFGELQRLIEETPDLAGRVRLVSFSVDPAHDSPEQLARFGEQYDANPEIWTFLTGEPGAVARLSEEKFSLAGQSPEPDAIGSASATHSDRFVLVDAKGRFRGHYRPTVEEGDFERLRRALLRLVSEMQDSPNG